MTNQKLLVRHINQLSEDEISSVLNAVTLMLETKELRQSLTALTVGLPLLSNMDTNAINSVFSAKLVYALLLQNLTKLLFLTVTKAPCFRKYRTQDT